jgi:F-type H+-transporting ATPase subunit b
MAPLWGLPTIVWQIINFALVVALFVYLLRGKLPAFFSGRAEGIRRELERAVREKDAALARLREVELKMSNLRAEVEAIEKDAAAAAESDRARILAEAEVSRERIRSEAVAEMQHRLAAAKRDLRSYAAQLVERLAREEVVKVLDGRDEEWLMEDFLRKLEAEDHERAG